MKKFLFSLLLLLSTSLVMAQNESGFIPVSTAQELLDAVKSNLSDDGTVSYAKIQLTADIYLSDLDSKGTLNNTFSGQIYGGYPDTDPKTGESIVRSYTIFGGHPNELDGGFHKEREFLFTYLHGASFEHVNFKFLRKQSDEHDNMGIIASQAWDSRFYEVRMDTCSVFCNNDNAGTLLGRAKNCTFEGVATIQSDVTVDGVVAGGLVGYSEDCQYTDCVTNLGTYVYADGNNGKHAAYSGGFVGYSKGDVFSQCVNMSIVGGNQLCVGGFTGQSEYSNFYSCRNFGAIAQGDEDSFKKFCKDQRAFLDSSISDSFAGLGVGIVDGIVPILLGVFITEYAGSVVGLAGALLGPIGIAVVAAGLMISVVGIFSFWPLGKVGGFSGEARGGIFDRCENMNSISQSTDNSGGIVGLGYGVTINNCLNGAIGKASQKSSQAAIIGCASVDDQRGDKLCLVTNCVSAYEGHVIGEEEGIDPLSGNNYCLVDRLADESHYEMAVDEATMKSGIVSYWLNQSAENRAEKPWQQKLTCDPTNPNDTIIDPHPVLDSNHPVVSINDLPKTTISTLDDLRTFAQRVNDGEQFACAVLAADIDMTGRTWIPIGKDEANRHFRGIFDGQGHTINGLKCESDQAVGLFGAVHVNAEIRNVIIGDDCEFTSTSDLGAGAIVGTADINWHWGNVIVENCGNYGKVNGKNNAGGIFGRMKGDMGEAVKAYINNCFSVGTITAEQGNSGLIGGYMRDNAVITNCWSAGKLVSSTGEAPFDATHNEFFAGYDNNINIENCYAIDPDKNVQGAGLATIQGGVSNYPLDALTNGVITYYLNGSTNNAANAYVWQQSLGKNTQPEFGPLGVYHTRTVSAESKGYGTVCLPYALKSGDDIRYYTFSESSADGQGVTLDFVFADSIPAGTPALFVTNPGDVTFTGAGEPWKNGPVAPASAIWLFTGTYAQKTFTGEDAYNIYYISGGAIKHGLTATIAPYRAYFDGPSIDELTSNGAKAARVRLVVDGIEDETLALEFVANDLLPEQSGKAYTLFGTVAGEGYRGIVVREGKKVLR